MTGGRKVVGIAAVSLVTLLLGVAAGMFVAGSASASSSTTSKKKTTTTKTTTSSKTTSTTTTKTKTTKTTTTSTLPTLAPGADPNSPAAKYFVINGTANAASDHEILGSSAFPNYTTGAVDNYYSMARTHVDNSPFAEGTASPADTGPIGQTAAAGNFQQSQYADARWPGSSGKATYGTQGQPYAAADAGEYKASAESSEASSGLSGPTGSAPIAAPKGFNGRLAVALAAWKAKWEDRLHPKNKPKPTVKVPTPPAKVTTPSVKVPTPVVTVTTPSATVSTPSVPVPSVTATPVPLPSVQAPSVPAPPVPVPSGITPGTATPSRSLSSAATGDGASLLESSADTFIDPRTGALVTSGESRLGRVSLGGGQIVLEGIHVTASITNDGTTAANKIAVTVGAATIGGVPVTIDQDGVHVNGQTQGLPYQQASDALNGALKQAGIELYLVSPEIKTGSCDQSGTSSSSLPTSTDQTSTTTSTTTTPTSTDQSGTSSCDQSSSFSSSSCDQSGTGGGTDTGTTTTTSSSPLGTPATSTNRTTTTSKSTTTAKTTTNATSSSCDQTGTSFGSSSSCPQAGTTSTSTSTDQTDTNTTPTSTTDQFGMGMGAGTPNSGEETVRATGVHVAFTQPVSQSGVPAQFADHILGEVFLDSLAVPAGPAGALPTLDLSSSSPFSLSSSSSPSCLNGGHSGRTQTLGGASKIGGGSSTGGPTASGSSSTSGSTLGSTSSQPGAGSIGGVAQPASGTTGGGSGLPGLPAGLASLLRSKPLWLLIAFLIWQALAIGTGASLWRWRRDGAS